MDECKDQVRIVFTMKDGRKMTESVANCNTDDAYRRMLRALDGHADWCEVEDKGDTYFIRLDSVASIEITAW